MVLADKIEITQADCELLCRLSGWGRDSENYERVMAGAAWTSEVEWIAKHRLAGERAGMLRASGIAAKRRSEWLAAIESGLKLVSLKKCCAEHVTVELELMNYLMREQAGEAL